MLIRRVSARGDTRAVDDLIPKQDVRGCRQLCLFANNLSQFSRSGKDVRGRFIAVGTFNTKQHRAAPDGEASSFFAIHPKNYFVRVIVLIFARVLLSVFS